ncbi:MKRN2 opposite strand protein isoform X2 [Passer domesticus]|uniref:MKRN2 opposite strand protein isoform X2 n=1 Tax=Passer domesticus TaxID=48849 RepID=UPI0030FF07C1
MAVLRVRHCRALLYCRRVPPRCPACGGDLRAAGLAAAPVRLHCPFRHGHGQPRAFLIRPTRGTFLDGYDGRSDLHVGITDSRGTRSSSTTATPSPWPSSTACGRAGAGPRSAKPSSPSASCWPAPGTPPATSACSSSWLTATSASCPWLSRSRRAGLESTACCWSSDGRGGPGAPPQGLRFNVVKHH